MTPIPIMKLIPEYKQQEQEFRAVLLKDIPYFHKLYAKYHDKNFLEIARNLGIAEKKLNHRIEMI